MTAQMHAFLFSLVLTTACVVGPAPGGPQSTSYNNGNQASECKMGSDGRQACGYHCKMGSDGVAACANTPDGSCAMESSGRVVCTNFQQPAAQPGAGSECKLNSDGSQSCGYNCKLGSDGYHYCATSPQGRCAMNSDGSWTCP